MVDKETIRPIGAIMCLICLEFAKSRMTIAEVRKALTELVQISAENEDTPHYRKLKDLDDAELRRQAEQFARENEDQ